VIAASSRYDRDFPQDAEQTGLSVPGGPRVRNLRFEQTIMGRPLIASGEVFFGVADCCAAASSFITSEEAAP
jgi:hypothetical protein